MNSTITPMTIITATDNGLASRHSELGNGASEISAKRLDSACTELESLFIHQLFQQMRATVPKSDLLGGGSAEELYTSMLDQELSKELAERGGIGLAALLKEQIALHVAPENPKDTE